MPKPKDYGLVSIEHIGRRTREIRRTDISAEHPAGYYTRAYDSPEISVDLQKFQEKVYREAKARRGNQQLFSIPSKRITQQESNVIVQTAPSRLGQLESSLEERQQGFTFYIDRNIYTEGLGLSIKEYQTMISALDAAARRSPNLDIIRPNGEVLDKNKRLSTRSNRHYAATARYKGNIVNIVRKALKKPDMDLGFTDAPVKTPTRREFRALQKYFIGSILNLLPDNVAIQDQVLKFADELGEQLLQALVEYKRSKDGIRAREAGIKRLSRKVGVRVRTRNISKAQINAFKAKGTRFSQLLDYRLLVPNADSVTGLNDKNITDIFQNMRSLARSRADDALGEIGQNFVSQYLTYFTQPLRRASSGAPFNIKAYSDAIRDNKVATSGTEYNTILGDQQTLFGTDATFPTVFRRSPSTINKLRKNQFSNLVLLGTQRIRVPQEIATSTDIDRDLVAIEKVDRKWTQRILDISRREARPEGGRLGFSRLSKEEVLDRLSRSISESTRQDLITLQGILNRDIKGHVVRRMGRPNDDPSRGPLRFQTGRLAGSVKIFDVSIIPFGRTTGTRASNLKFELSSKTRRELREIGKSRGKILIHYDFKRDPYATQYTGKGPKGARGAVRGQDLDSRYLRVGLRGGRLYRPSRDVRRLINGAITSQMNALRFRFKILPTDLEFDTSLGSNLGRLTQGSLSKQVELLDNISDGRASTILGGKFTQIIDQENLRPDTPPEDPFFKDRPAGPVTQTQVSSRPEGTDRTFDTPRPDEVQQFIDKFVFSANSAEKKVRLNFNGKEQVYDYNKYIEKELGNFKGTIKSEVLVFLTNNDPDKNLYTFMDSYTTELKDNINDASKRAEESFNNDVRNAYLGLYAGSRKESDYITFEGVGVPPREILVAEKDNKKIVKQRKEVSRKSAKGNLIRRMLQQAGNDELAIGLVREAETLVGQRDLVESLGEAKDASLIRDLNRDIKRNVDAARRLIEDARKKKSNDRSKSKLNIRQFKDALKRLK